MSLNHSHISARATYHPARLSRHERNRLATLDADTGHKLARIDAEVEIQQESVRAINHVGTAALIATAQLSQAEVALAQMAPHASGRLAAIADLTALQSAEVVVETAQRLRRVTR
ncbi:hypothetical protein TSOC111612_00880 [Tsukamurella ocularis]|uniref:hypothetical protein n=1 Tax=Tsukamurella ocularis TaxID=1970234 RepID=UPI0039EFCAE7